MRLPSRSHLRAIELINFFMENLVSAEENKAIVAILTRELGVDASELKPDSRLDQDLSADSLALVEIQLALEERFNLTIPDERIEQVRTVRDVYELIAEFTSAK